SKSPITRISQLPGKKVGVVQGYLWNEDLEKVLGAGTLRLYQAVPALVSDIENGRIAVGVLAGAEAALRVTQRSGAGLGAYPVEPDARVAASTAPGQIVFAHTKGNVALTKALNEDIAALRVDGTLARILTRHGLPESAGQIG
ncbi:MAG: amino acid ABC transporter substrate-binding protein, partial [Acidimicrobiia bacterium]